VRVMPGRPPMRMGKALPGRARSHIAQVDWLDFSARDAIILHKTERWLESRAIRGLLYE
jgi:hypothetical protein